MRGLYVIEDRDATGAGLARSGLRLDEANRLRDDLAHAYPRHCYTVQPQRMVGRGQSRRVEYPQP